MNRLAACSLTIVQGTLLILSVAACGSRPGRTTTAASATTLAESPAIASEDIKELASKIEEEASMSAAQFEYLKQPKFVAQALAQTQRMHAFVGTDPAADAVILAKNLEEKESMLAAAFEFLGKPHDVAWAREQTQRIHDFVGKDIAGDIIILAMHIQEAAAGDVDAFELLGRDDHKKQAIALNQFMFEFIVKHGGHPAPQHIKYDPNIHRPAPHKYRVHLPPNNGKAFTVSVNVQTEALYVQRINVYGADYVSAGHGYHVGVDSSYGAHGNFDLTSWITSAPNNWVDVTMENIHPTTGIVTDNVKGEIEYGTLMPKADGRWAAYVTSRDTPVSNHTNVQVVIWVTKTGGP